jgi:hypothetical protein
LIALRCHSTSALLTVPNLRLERLETFSFDSPLFFGANKEG